MTTISSSLVITGELITDEDLTIEGRVDGTVSVRSATLIIGEQARVKSDLRGGRVVVRGAVDGAISATERIELAPSAVVNGSLSANRVVIADAATFNGRVDMAQRTIAAKIAQFKTAQKPA